MTGVTKTEAAEFIQSYLDAFSRRDLEQCLGFYSPDANMTFGPVHVRGKDDLARWHRERFDANVSVFQVEGVSVDGNVVRLEAKMTSNRLKTWRINTISGSAEFTFAAGKVSVATFRMNPKSVVPLVRGAARV